MNKRAKKIIIKTKIIGILPNSEKKSKKNNNKRGDDVNDKEEEVVGLPNSEFIDKEEAEKDKQSVPDAFQFLNLEGLTTNEINRISDILGVKALLPEPEEKTPEHKMKGDGAKAAAWSCPFDDERFVQRINKFRKQRMNKRVKKITIKTKIIGKLPNSKKKNKKNNNKRGADTKDSILNLPSVVSSLTTDIMKQSAIDEAAVRKVFAGGDDATEGDMEAVAAGGGTDILGKGGG